MLRLADPPARRESRPAVDLRPDGDQPERALVAIDLPRVAAILDRIAADIDKLAGARRVGDLAAAAVLPGRRAERRRRLAEPDLEFRASAPGGGCPLPRPRNRNGPGTPGRPSDTNAARSASGPSTPITRSGHANDHPVPQRTPGPFRTPDAIACWRIHRYRRPCLGLIRSGQPTRTVTVTEGEHPAKAAAGCSR